MKIEKTSSSMIQMRQDNAAAAEKAKAAQAQQNQHKQAQAAAAAQDVKKAQEDKKGGSLKGGEINITA
jgi:hypothetical protein